MRDAKRPQLLASQAIDAAGHRRDLACLGFEQADQGLAEGGLAGAGFPDQAQRFAALELKAQAVDGLQVEVVLALKKPPRFKV